MARRLENLKSIENRVLLIAVALSLALHVSLLAAVLSHRIEFSQSAAPASVLVRLVPANPQQVETVAALEAPGAPVPIDTNVESTPASEALVPESLGIKAERDTDTAAAVEESIALSEPRTVRLSELENRDSAIEKDAAEQAQTSRLFVPSVVTVQETLRRVQEQIVENSRSWAQDCNILEEESELYSCDEQDRRNYQSLQRNQTYEALNPTRELSRSQRTLPTITENTSALAGRLALSGIPQGLSDYLMEEVEAGVILNSNLGNRAVGQLRAMTDKSAAGAMAREILGDAWVVTRAKELQQRKVHTQ